MPLLPSKNSAKEFDQSAVAVLTDLKKGGNDKRNEFIWVHQERIYAVALLGTGDHEHACRSYHLILQQCLQRSQPGITERTLICRSGTGFLNMSLKPWANTTARTADRLTKKMPTQLKMVRPAWIGKPPYCLAFNELNAASALYRKN
jgi:hypothetical protein